MNPIEEKRNKLNLEIRILLSLIDVIDGKPEEYLDYKENSMKEEQFLDEQIKLVVGAKNRIMDIFKD